MMSPFQSIDNTSTHQYLKKPSDALQDKAHSNQVSLSTAIGLEKNIRVEYVGTKEHVAYILKNRFH
jgi:hypothetical protein